METEELSPDSFLNSSLARTPGSIRIACDKDGKVLYNREIAERAKNMIGNSREYNLILDNCHQFTCGCITGEYEGPNKSFGMVEKLINEKLNNGNGISSTSIYHQNSSLCAPHYVKLNNDSGINWLVWDRNY